MENQTPTTGEQAALDAFYQRQNTLMANTEVVKILLTGMNYSTNPNESQVALRKKLQEFIEVLKPLD